MSQTSLLTLFIAICGRPPKDLADLARSMVDHQKAHRWEQQMCAALSRTTRPGRAHSRLTERRTDQS